MSDEDRTPEQLDFMEELRRYHDRRPFHPFDLLTTSGEKYAIQDAVEFALGHSAVIVVLPKTGVQIVRLSQITAMHVHEPV